MRPGYSRGPSRFPPPPREGGWIDEPVFLPAELIREARAGRSFDAAATGLWCAGRLDGLARPCVAIVGTRAATPLGKRLAHTFAADLGAAGCTIVSGLALGIDAAAHEGALDARASTVGVLGSGHGHFFPSRNRGLAERILAGGGAVLSPYPPDQIAQPWQFLQRNGVVAALADAVLVVEAPARSGALNTAGWAAGRVPVLAVPGDVDRRHVQGCLSLIRDGAVLARDAGDVLEALGSLAPRTANSQERDLRRERDPLLDALRDGAATLDELVAATGLSPATALGKLAMLELQGAVETRSAGAFAARERR